MSARERMLEALVAGGAPLCDDCVWEPSGMKYRQQAYSRGRELASAGAIVRMQGECSRCRKIKTVSIVTGQPLPETQATDVGDRPWFWEGSVQATLVSHLQSEGWTLLSSANTSTKEAGVDVKALDVDGVEWWITVKGYPERKAGKTTNPSTQARHWFSHAMFDVVMYRTERPDVRIGVAVPGPFQTYESGRPPSLGPVDALGSPVS
jgi:hypothetical protein